MPAPATAPTDPAPPRPRLDLAQSLQNVDAALELLQQAQQKLAAAARLAEAAEQHGKEAEIEKVVKAASALQSEIEALTAALAQIDGLRAARERAADEAPASLLRPAGSPGREEIDAAFHLPTAADAEAALAALETKYLDRAYKGQDRDELVALVRFRIGDALRQRAAVAIRRGNGGEGERTLLRAVAKYAEVLAQPDLDDSGEGSSLHAAALFRTVQIEANLYQGYRELAARPNGSQYQTSVRNHREAAERAYERLKRSYPDARTADNRSFVDAAKEEAARMAR